MDQAPVEVSFLVVDGGSSMVGDEGLLDDVERARMADFGSPEARGRYLASHAFLRRVLSRHLGVDPVAIRYDRGCEECGHPSHGRPRLQGAPAPVSFSLSHSGRHVVVALGEGPLGVDIEDTGRRPVADNVVRRCATGAEQVRLGHLAPGQRPRAFLQLWTRKEAVAKALGLGLVLPFSSFDVSGPGAVVARSGAPALNVENLELDGAVGAVAVPPGTTLRAGATDPHVL